MSTPSATPTSTLSSPTEGIEGGANLVRNRSRRSHIGGLRSDTSRSVAVASFPREIRRPREQDKMSRLTREQALFIEAQLDGVIAKMDLVLSQYPTSLTGGSNLAENTSRQYGSIFNCFKLFLQRIGDFESLIIFKERAPIKFCPSLSADSLIAYIDYKILPAGTPVVISADTAVNHDRIGPALDIFTEQPLVATGSWKCPGAVNQFLSAISTLHVTRDQGGQYCEPCSDCIEDYAQRHGTCRFHADYPRLWRSGTPRKLRSVKNRYQRVTKTDLKGYVPQGNSPLLPHELIDIRNSLLSTNCVENLRLWVMILFHVQLFLRASEGCFFKFEDFIHGLSSVDSQTGQIVAIGVKIKGKSDDNPHLLMIWRNDQVPELCLIRHLLAWIQISGRKTGFLFPDHTGKDGFDYEFFQNR
jgi:hypothetical protein